MARRPPPSHRIRVENEMIRRREKEFCHDRLWNGQRRYYEDFERKNTKYDEWTSPRYYENQQKLMEKTKKEREHEENLERRRAKLKKLLYDEEKLQEAELQIRKVRNMTSVRSPRPNEIPTEILKELNNGLKLEEEERRRHQAELKLYHQWRSSNPFLNHYERMQASRDLKLSWLDQQIENRMKKEKEEEECRKLLKEREKIMKEEQEKFDQEQKRLQLKKEELKASLEQQIDEMRLKTQISEDLKRKEDEERRKKAELDEIALKRIEEEKKRLERECALDNIKQHKLKLKKKAEDVVKTLDEERYLIMKLKELEIAERLEDEMKKIEVKAALDQFLALNEEQKKLEKIRQKNLDFLFDSEAKTMYEQQEKFWKEEEASRAKLLKDVIDTIQGQIQSNIEKNRRRQLEVIQEREEMLKKIEEHNQEMARLKEEEETKKRKMMSMLKNDLEMKNLKKKAKENAELRRIDEELERVRKEEERLKQEILNIQRRQGPIKSTRSKSFFC
ncbi:trichoplein keratin filament-binding protein [Tribolium castaneum]|uniref:Trichoplein keratin filament-binding protein n=1 Tax=Tribolium castaneum TaxID=7070 RepID=D2A6F1_TRICA|nr:PREDICTED: trichoplein keratin filament-binding protein [Tribolium castaneum]EFA04930.2 hypothetical protein TcasGA2_TC014996 [Tribolium castaneum]|eukprot:XP_969483.2 PREDICTED: trichoplein keratin filament-binding protein [Tribolium castaneum]